MLFLQRMRKLIHVERETFYLANGHLFKGNHSLNTLLAKLTNIHRSLDSTLFLYFLSDLICFIFTGKNDCNELLQR